MTANAVLMALQTAFLQTGSEFGCILYSDSGSNIVPLMKLHNNENGENGENENENENRNDESEIIDNLRRTLHRNNIVLKTNTPSSSWRSGLVESVVKLFKNALKRAGLMNKTHSLPQWQYIAMKCQKEINDRPLNINYINDRFEVCSPNFLMYGRSKMSMQQKIDLGSLPRGGEKLFGRLAELDDNLKKFQDIWWNSYMLDSVKWLKWRNSGRKLKIDDCVYILDKTNPETKQNVLALVTEVKSDRTYKVEFVQKSMKVDPKTFEVTKAARKSTLDRPAQKLTLITTKDECKDFSIEPRGLPGLLENTEENPIFINDEINTESFESDTGEMNEDEDLEIINPTIASDEIIEENDYHGRENQINENIGENIDIATGENQENVVDEIVSNIVNENTVDDLNDEVSNDDSGEKTNIPIQQSKPANKIRPILTIQDDAESIKDLPGVQEMLKQPKKKKKKRKRY